MTATTSSGAAPTVLPPQESSPGATTPNPRTRSRWRRAVPVVLLYVISVGVALALCALLVSATGGSASEVFSALIDGSLRSPGAWGLTVNTAAPLLCVASTDLPSAVNSWGALLATGSGIAVVIPAGFLT